MTLTQDQLDELWDFADAPASERRFAAAAASAVAGDRAEFETQRARALGLQERFDDADAALDAVVAGSAAARVRVALERGRVRNSAGDAGAAIPFFRTAAEDAASAGLLFLRVDALHMLAIADAANAAAWTAEALAALDGTDDPRTLRWRVGLHNNAGWARLDAGDPDAALLEFTASRDAAVRWGTPQQVAWADEAIAEARAAQSRPIE